MTRRQTGAPGPPPRQPAGAQSALVIQGAARVRRGEEPPAARRHVGPADA